MSYILKLLKNNFLLALLSFMKSKNWVNRQKNDQFVKKAKQLGYINHVSTNASLIPRALEGLKYVDNLQISVEGWDKESYEKFRYPLNFDKVYNNLKILNQNIDKKNQNRYIHLPMTKNTDLRKFLKLWGEFVNFIKVDYMQPANLFSKGIMKSEYNPKIKDEYYDFTRKEKDFACFDPFAEIVVGFFLKTKFPAILKKLLKLDREPFAQLA